MGIEPFWANLYFSKHESHFMSKLIKKYFGRNKLFQGIFQFIDDLCGINDGGDFQKQYKEIYPKEPELKLEYSGSQATFLDIDTAKGNGTISSKLYDKCCDFSFFCYACQAFITTFHHSHKKRKNILETRAAFS